MNGMAMIEEDSFDRKARAVCADRGWETLEDMRRVSWDLRMHAYHDAIRPFVKARADMFSYKLPKYTLYSDGRMETVIEWTDEEKKTQAMLTELIEREAHRVGLAEQKEGSR